MSKKTKSGVAFFEGSSWYHRTKVLQEDGTVKYSKKGGFQNESDAEESYYQYEESFTKAWREYQLRHNADANIGFKDYLIYWFEEIFSKRIESTTRMLGVYVLYNIILPNVETDIKLKYLNKEYLDSLLERVSGISQSAGNKSREFLNIALKEAVVQGRIKNNPVLDTKTYPRTKPKVTILSTEKLVVFVKAASKTNWYLEVLLALFCGLRKGEILGAKFSDIDFERKSIHIQRQITSNPIVPSNTTKITEYQIVEKEPKTENSNRILALPNKIFDEVLIRQTEIMADKEREGKNYVDLDYISCRNNGMPHGLSAMNTALTKICDRNGLPHITVHGLRHMYATILLEEGVPLTKISALLGHSSVNVTFEYYCDQMDENMKIISFMNSHFVPEEETY